MKIMYNKFLIISTLVLLVGCGYLYISRDLDSKGMVPVAFGSSLASVPLGNEDPLDPEFSSSSDGGKISSDISFLTTLVSLKRIKVDTTIFKNEAFKILKNNAVEIKSIEAGRKNPFASIDTNKSSNNVVINSSSVITDQPSQITDKSVILNGTVNVASGVSDLYFEYGLTENLGTVTSSVEQSLVGTFLKSILGLTTDTNYFYKACAKINNSTFCGDVVSFTTN